MKTNLKSPIFACAMLAALAMLAPSVLAYGQSKSRSNTLVKDKDYVAPNFPKTEEIKFTILNNDLPASWPQSNLILCDSVMFVNAECIENQNVFHIFRLKDGKYIRGFANWGRAANELNDYRRITLTDDGKILHAMDNNNRSIDIDLQKAISGETSFVVKSYKLPRGPISREIHSVGNNLLHTENGRKIPRFVITNRECTDTLCSNDQYTPTKTSIDESQIDKEDYYYYNSAFGVRPDGTRSVNVTGNGMLMEIYDIQNNKMRSIALRRFHRPKMGDNMRKGASDCVYGGLGIYVTNDYIYVRYHDEKREIDSKYIKTSIAVFDWNGKEVARYKSDTFIMSFAVTPDDKRAYCWTVNVDGEEAFCYFDLN